MRVPPTHFSAAFAPAGTSRRTALTVLDDFGSAIPLFVHLSIVCFWARTSRFTLLNVTFIQGLILILCEFRTAGRAQRVKLTRETCRHRPARRVPALLAASRWLHERYVCKSRGSLFQTDRAPFAQTQSWYTSGASVLGYRFELTRVAHAVQRMGPAR